MSLISDTEIIYNNKSCKELGLIVAEFPLIPQLEEKTEQIEVIGKTDGNLIKHTGEYYDRQIEVSFSLLNKNKESILGLNRNINKWLRNAEDKRLVINDKDYCFMVKDIEYGNIERECKLYGSFTVTFTVAPFMCSYLTKTQNIIGLMSSGNLVTNDGDFPVRPIIIVRNVSGTVNISINNKYSIILSNLVTTNTITIDCEKRYVVDENNQSFELNVSGSFPILEVGDTTIDVTGTNITNTSSVKVKFKTLYY